MEIAAAIRLVSPAAPTPLALPAPIPHYGCSMAPVLVLAQLEPTPTPVNATVAPLDASIARSIPAPLASMAAISSITLATRTAISSMNSMITSGPLVCSARAGAIAAPVEIAPLVYLIIR